MSAQSHDPVTAGRPFAGRFPLYASTAYVLLILYGSLFPFAGWTQPAKPLFSFLMSQPSYDRADMLQNLLVYMPLGLLVVAWLNTSMRYGRALVWAVVLGAGLSFAVESIQQFLPARVASLSDLVLNALGTLVGGWLAALVSRQTLTGSRMLQHRRRFFKDGVMANVAIAVLFLWVLSQTTPLVPSLDPAHLRHGFALLKLSYLRPDLFDIGKFVTYGCYVLALGLLASSALRPERRVQGLFTALVAVVLVSKILVVGRQLAMEALLGAAIACVLLLPLWRVAAAWQSLLGLSALVVGFTAYELTPSSEFGVVLYYPFNWVPFLGQMRRLSGLENILELLWPFMAMAYFSRFELRSHRPTVCAFGSAVVLAYLFVMEWQQQYVPGRSGDVTQIMLGFVGWLLPWWVGRDQPGATPGQAVRL